MQLHPNLNSAIAQQANEVRKFFDTIEELRGMQIIIECHMTFTTNKGGVKVKWEITRGVYENRTKGSNLFEVAQEFARRYGWDARQKTELLTFEQPVTTDIEGL